MWIWSKEAAYGIVRTVVAFVWSWAVSNIPAVVDWLDGIGLDQATFVLVFGGLLYSAVRWAAEKWGWLGYILILNQKPEYTPTQVTITTSSGSEI